MAPAIGAAAVAWPLIDQMNPTAAVLALASIEVDLAPIQVGQAVTVVFRGHPLFVRRDLERIFAYRHQAVPELLASSGNPAIPAAGQPAR